MRYPYSMSEDDIERGKLKFRETTRRLGPSARLELRLLGGGKYHAIFSMGGKTSSIEMDEGEFADFATNVGVGARITGDIKAALREIGALV